MVPSNENRKPEVRWRQSNKPPALAQLLSGNYAILERRFSSTYLSTEATASAETRGWRIVDFRVDFFLDYWFVVISSEVFLVCDRQVERQQSESFDADILTEFNICLEDPGECFFQSFKTGDLGEGRIFLLHIHKAFRIEDAFTFVD